MYYTIEGKKLLVILYLAGCLLGALIVNVGIQKGIFHFYDFLDFTGYITTLKDNNAGDLFSYVVFIRIRQLIIFILGIFILSPYVAYCLFTSLLALTLGSFVSLMVIRFGWTGIIYSMIFSFPQGIFYGLTLLAAYSYIFTDQKSRQFYKMQAVYSKGHTKGLTRIRPLLEHRVVISVICISSFTAGCFGEAYLNPLIIEKVWRLHLRGGAPFF